MTIHLRLQSEQDRERVIQKLRSLYGLRVDVHSVDDQSIAVSFQRRTVSEWFAETFIPGQAAEARYRAAVALNDVCGIPSARIQRAQHDRDQWMWGTDIIGGALASHIAMIAGKFPRLATSARIHANRRGNVLNFLRAPAVQVACDFTILGTEAARRELAALQRQRGTEGRRGLAPADAGSLDSFRHFERQLDEMTGTVKTLPVDAAARQWICIRDFAVPDAGRAHPALAVAEINRCLNLAMNSATAGAVVIEPFADRMLRKNRKSVRGFSDEGLQAQLEAAHDAMMRNKHLVVSFASDDDELLQRLQRLAANKPRPSATGFVRSFCRREAPSQPGIHYLLNDPLQLNAERIIVPASLLQKTRFRALSEQELADPSNVTWRAVDGPQWVAMADTLEIDKDARSPADGSAARAGSRYDNLLAGVQSRVVIHPPPISSVELGAMMSAVHAYCKIHPHVAVSIAFHGDVANRRADLLMYAMQRAGLIAQPHDIQWDTV